MARLSIDNSVGVQSGVMVDTAAISHHPGSPGRGVRRALGPPPDWTGSAARTSGWVIIPDHVDPTNPQRVYEIDDADERKYLYEIVLADGNADDINRLIDGGTLAELWDRLYLPRHVRCAWRQAVGW